MPSPSERSMLCADSDGLCLAATGDLPEETSGVYHNLIQMASQLSSSGGEHAPVIRIETDDGSTIVKTYESYTVAVQLPVKGASKDDESSIIGAPGNTQPQASQGAHTDQGSS